MTKGTPEKLVIRYEVSKDRTTVPGLVVFETFDVDLALVWFGKCRVFNSFVKEFKQRLTDRFKQDWHAALESHDFYNV